MPFVTVELPNDVQERLETEAARRGVSVKALIRLAVGRELAMPPEIEADSGR